MIKIDKEKFQKDRLEYLCATEIRYAEGKGKTKNLSLVGKIALIMDQFAADLRRAAPAGLTIGQRIAHRFLSKL